MKKHSVLPDTLKGRTLGDMVVGEQAIAHVDALVVDNEGYCYVDLRRTCHRVPNPAWKGLYLTITRHEDYMEVDMFHAMGWRWFYDSRPGREGLTLPAYLTGVGDHA